MSSNSPAFVIGASAVATFGVLPAFLTGALVVQLGNELALTIAQIGILSATLFIVSALLARLAARFVTAFGTPVALCCAPLCSAIGLVIAATAHGMVTLVLALAVGGAANALAQPTTNQRLAETISPGRLGFAFGVKQAAVPTATLIAGLTVPFVAPLVGWRGVFLLAAVVAALTALIGIVRLAPNRRLGLRAITRASGRLPTVAMLTFSASAFLASVVGTSFGVFFIDTAVARLGGLTAASITYAAYSVAGIGIRVLLGLLIDSRRTISAYVLTVVLLAVGGAGFILLAATESWVFAAGGFLAFSLGWAWPGILHFAIVRDNMANPARATAQLQSGSSLGAGVGPLAFGLLIAASDHQTAWTIAAVLSLAAAMGMLIGVRLEKRSRPR